jgi:hypothetical protein
MSHLSPTQIVWEAAGSTAVDRCETAEGVCYVCCGPVTRGQLVADWLGSSYTDQNRARHPMATHVCEACVFVHSRISPVPGRPPKKGKKYGGNWRNYAHLWESGVGYSNASKGEKPAIREFLEREHVGDWFAAIADSGQKHVLPFTPMNGPGRSGVVMLDDLRVLVPDDVSLVAIMTDLLTRGCTKEGLETGRHNVGAFERIGEDLLSFEREHGRRRGSPWFTLALWLAQRDEEAVAARVAAEKESKDARRKGKRKVADAHGRSDSGTQGRVPAKRPRKRAETLGTARDASQGSGGDQREPGGVRDAIQPRPATGGPQQGRLPGFD